MNRAAVTCALLIWASPLWAGHGMLNAFGGIAWLPPAGTAPDSPWYPADRWQERAALALAERSEAAERWADAARAYSSALALDKGLGDLSPKLERARSRAALQQRLAEAIKAAGPGADLAGAAAVLEDARRIPNPGPRHRATSARRRPG